MDGGEGGLSFLGRQAPVPECRSSMDLFYIIIFGALAALAAALELTKPADITAIKNGDFRSFRNNYLLVYSMMMGADPPAPPPPHTHNHPNMRTLKLLHRSYYAPLESGPYDWQ